MKKFTLILALIGMITLQSCTVNNDDRDGIDNDTIAEVFEYTNVNFLPNDYTVVLEYPHSIFTSDMVLVYRLSGSFQGEDIWKPLPETYYFGDGTLDLRYDFDFTRFDAQVYMEGFDLAGVSSSYRLNQILRVVVIPASFGKNSTVNLNDYNAVVSAFNIDESKIIKM
ncbi:hypothetical protein WMW71_06955 [Flavobacterium buctense]|uniref:Dihydrolipoamide dehydrogenase n=1 Tax=Flavobacterium buctense TaxID=1648146 RepID=A0ABU9E0U3_9FLAO|nr:hypothetical protein [Flavobacterium buctense]